MTSSPSVRLPLKKKNPEIVIIANRSPDRARRLASAHSDLGPVASCTPGELVGQTPFDLVINATSLGHLGKAPDLSGNWLKKGALCYDMNYAEAALPLREHCRITGIRYRDGLGMLVAQAALSFELWTGERPETRPVLAHLRPAG